MPDEYFTEDGSPADVDALEVGDVVYDAEGNAFEAQVDDAEPAYEEVGKSAFFGSQSGPSRSLADEVREALSKAATEDQRDEVIAKALDEISKADQRAAQAEEIAKAERTLRLEREYIGKAAEYNVPVDADELGPVLMRMADTMDYADCAVIHKALTAAGEMLFTEAGYAGQADNLDPFAQVDAYLDEQVHKSAAAGQQVSKAEAMTDFFATNPEAYDEYVAGLGR